MPLRPTGEDLDTPTRRNDHGAASRRRQRVLYSGAFRPCLPTIIRRRIVRFGEDVLQRFYGGTTSSHLGAGHKEDFLKICRDVVEASPEFRSFVCAPVRDVYAQIAVGNVSSRRIDGVERYEQPRDKEGNQGPKTA